MEISFEISEDELPVFLGETDEQLQLLDEGLLQLEREGESMELLQALFRAAHTLKGAAGMIAHKRMVSLTHALETAFDGLRKETYKASPELLDLCFEAIDALRSLREEVIQGRTSNVDVEQLTDRFSELVLSYVSETQPTKEKQPASLGVKTNEQSVQGTPTGQFLIEADISPTSIASAARAFQLMLALQDLGEIISMDPSQEDIDSAKPVKRFTASLQSTSSIAEVRQLLGDISEIDRLVVTESGSPTVGSGPSSTESQGTSGTKETKIKQTTTETSSDQKAASQSKFGADKTVRTSVERLDNLMNLVGELITDRNRLQQLRSTFEANYRGNEDVEVLAQTVAHINRITDELQSEVMSIRMVPIANVFNKFPRMIRDLANKLNKKVDFIVQGEDTELDRSLIELINDPLIHLLRNALDHGVETPEERRQAGKSESGRVLLAAQHEQGQIIITIEDDGKGMDLRKLKEKAIKKGFITESEAENMHDEDAINLIFFSGFSTASIVSDVSGRGVGMDIVRNNIQRLGGSLNVESWNGHGSRFQIILPLTLAIVQTLLVRIGSNRLAIPLATVNKSLVVKEEDIQTLNSKPVVLFMGKVLPLLRLSELFGFEQDSNSTYQYVVVVNSGKQQMGLLVDRLLGEEEVVVKSLGALVGEIDGISSAAILGDGHVILILDVQDLFKLAGVSQYKR